MAPGRNATLPCSLSWEWVSQEDIVAWLRSNGEAVGLPSTPVSVSKQWIKWFRSEFQSAGCLCIRADRTLRRELRGEG